MTELLLIPLGLLAWALFLGVCCAVLLAPVALLGLVAAGLRRLRPAAVAQQASLLDLRACDEDRRRVLDELAGQFAVGRLTLPELERRSEAGWAAQTPRGLLELTRDLPAAAPVAAASRIRPWLRAAAFYNLCWGGAVALAGPSPAWRCVGMLVLVWSPAYWWASLDPLRHAHVVLVATIGKILGPVGFVVCALTGALPLAFGVVVLANDVVWWPAFGRFLRAAAQAAGGWRPFAGGAKPGASAL